MSSWVCRVGAIVSVEVGVDGDSMYYSLHFSFTV